MREILFRSKRIDNGEWVQGCLTRYSEAMSYITVDLLEQEVYQVHTETVGLYTGLLDKNGIRIFEGDIDKSGFIVTYVDSSDTGNLGMFIGFYTQRDNLESWLELSVGDEIEVIGNIHEMEVSE